ncbi:hypothetical protein NC653_005789 [Populus alba x Populus x berolinensis]|uniref:Uncharacterized protein n=1 Tax=Populus alba x Populus x berolinensis TaxID=444605 RepID=A0AAD6RCU2_9ROSI|nr:hypothetical protein NC653_005789 [Populus alba x Populus x berolinensis]
MNRKQQIELTLESVEGDEEGAGSFLGIICSQLDLDNLDASEERTMKARRVKSKHFCLQETNMLNTIVRRCLESSPLTFQSSSFREFVPADMLSNIAQEPNKSN